MNPEHLYAGTRLDNARDASRRGRLANQRKTECPRCGGVFADYRGRQRICVPCARVKQAERDQRKNADPEYRAAQNVRRRSRYALDPEYRAAQKARKRAEYALSVNRESEK